MQRISGLAGLIVIPLIINISVLAAKDDNSDDYFCRFHWNIADVGIQSRTLGASDFAKVY